jgi:hypothetical protein
MSSNEWVDNIYDEEDCICNNLDHSILNYFCPLNGNVEKGVCE